MSDRSAQNIAGYTWQQKQSFGTVNNAVENSRGGIGMIGAAMMMGGGMNGNPGMGSAMMTPNGNGNFAQQSNGSTPINQKSIVFCSRCGKSYSPTNRFCPHCGDPYNPCPVCGRDNDQNAKKCAVCGASLQGQNTLNNMMSGNVCSRCGSCSTCRNKILS